jgi:hypothetical protein
MARKKKEQRIRMLISMAGNTFSHVPGDILEVSEEVAKAWVENNIAELVEGDK